MDEVDFSFPSFEELPELYLTSDMPLCHQYDQIFPTDERGHEKNMYELAPTFINVPMGDLRMSMMFRGCRLPEYKSFKLGTQEMLNDFRKLEHVPKGETRIGLEFCLDAPVFTVSTEEEARSLEAEVLKTEICIVRGLTEVAGLDLEKFNSDLIRMKVSRGSNVEVRKQDPQPRCFNYIKGSKTPTWQAEAKREYMKVKGYINYQSRQRKHEAKRAETWGDYDVPTYVKEGLIFGTNLDMDKPEVWREQIQEVEKLPAWATVKSEQNLLSYLHYTVQGMNAMQMYLKVRESRTPAHQENLNFCSVNINAGPGDTEWFAVDYCYWEIVMKMCKTKGVNFASSAWWPDILDLQRAGVPVRRFLQKPGDLVYVNRGCIHWVQAESVCNNIAWNVGPLVSEQFRAALVRYEENLKLEYESIVPMRRMVWDFVLGYKDLNSLELPLRKDMAYVCALILIEDLMIARDIKEYRILSFEEEEKQYMPQDFAVFQKQYERLNLVENLPVFRYCGKCGKEIVSFFFFSLDAKVKLDESFDNVVRCMSCVKKVPVPFTNACKQYAFMLQQKDEDYDTFCLNYEKLRQGILIEEYRRRQVKKSPEVSDQEPMEEGQEVVFDADEEDCNPLVVDSGRLSPSI